MALINDLKQLLRENFPDSKVKLSVYTPSNMVGGTLIWDGFDGQPQIDRQTRLREVVEGIPQQDRQKVSFILTITPDEHTGMTSR